MVNYVVNADRDKSIAQEYEAGASSLVLAKKYGITPERVIQVLANKGVPRRLPAKPRRDLFDLVMMRANGMEIRHIAIRDGTSKSNIARLLCKAGVRKKDLLPLLKLSNKQLAVYREALDGDKLTHPDALEISMEY